MRRHAAARFAGQSRPMSSGKPQVRAVMSEAVPLPGRSPRWRGVAWAGAAAALVPLVFLGGFAAFVVSLEGAEREPSQRADAIVALTGGAQRVEDAVELLDKGYAGRLLITGVNRRTSRAAIQRLSPGQRQLFDCCVDLDYRARDTVENAAEIGRWVRGHGFRSLIVVTSNYHLPRTLAELEVELPEVRKLPYAVVTGPGSDAWTHRVARVRLLLSEYTKYVAASVRTRAAGWLSARGDTRRA